MKRKMRYKLAEHLAKWMLPFCLAAFLPTPALAQEETDPTEIEDEDEDEQEAEAGASDYIDFPAAMTSELDSLLNLYNSKTYLITDEDCRSKNENPYFAKEVYIARLQRMPTVIEMPYNEVVQRFIDRYAERLRPSVSYLLGAQNFYMPIFEEALDLYNLPLELRYLPVIESALNPKAVSRVGATGLWQFMLGTGRQYGLKTNSLVDERCDPVKASNAAARLLRDLYKLFGDWHLVIAAYNCGPENVNKAIHRANGAHDYWEIYPYLPRETRGYVPAFIAANYIMNYYCEHGICPMRSSLPEKTDTVMVSENFHLKQIAAVLNLDLDMLRALNPVYRRDIVPGLSELSAIRLPQGDVGRFIDLQDSIRNYQARELIGKRAEVAIPDDPQPVVRTKTTRGGKSKKVSRTSSRRSKSAARRSSGGSASVTVKSGQTLSEIARKNHTTVAKLKKLNNIKGSTIRAGKKLKVK